MFSLIILVIAAAQGGAVFATAWLAWKKLRLAHAAWKPLLMVGSYIGWAALTLLGFTLLGGGGLMDGLVMVLFLLFTCAVSSAVYLAAWWIGPLLVGSARQ